MTKAALAIAMAASMLAQTPATEKKAEFEVASIRPAIQDGNHDSDVDNDLVRIHNLTLKRLIANAWQIDPGQISGGPSWIDSDGFDINARIPAELVRQRRDVVPQMLQSLLADRFQLVIHREPRQISGYALVVAKKGAKMEPASAGEKDSDIRSTNTHLTGRNVTMEAFARHLSRNRDIGKLVVDRTGLTSAFNFELDWMPQQFDAKPEASSDDRPSIFTALQEQLGLKLESAAVPALAIVIDHAEKPGDN